MSVASSSPSRSFFELRNASLALIALVLKTSDLALLSRGLEERFGQTPLFDHDPVALDLSHLADDATPIDFVALHRLLRLRRMLPIGVEGGSVAQMAAALEAGLGASNTFASVGAHGASGPPAAPASTATATEAASSASRSSPTASSSTSAAPAEPRPSAHLPTMVIDRPLRSGQQVYARDADLVVLASVSFGAEVIADGHVHVYAPLRGRAVAGARGNTSARIFSTCMEAQLVAIAGTYRTLETQLPVDVHGRPAQVRLDGDLLVIEPLQG